VLIASVGTPREIIKKFAAEVKRWSKKRL